MDQTIVHVPSLSVLEEADPILEALPDGLLFTDALGRITYVNEPLQDMAQRSREELLGMSVDMLVPERLRSTHMRNREGFYADPRTRAMGTNLDTKLLRADGTEVPVQIQLAPAEVGEEPGVFATVRDGEENQADRLMREYAVMVMMDRDRIARDIGITAIHALFAIGLRLQAGTSGTSDERAILVMDQAIEDIDRAITEMRQAMLRHRSATLA